MSRKNRTIVKVQRQPALAGKDHDQPWLLYSEGRRMMIEQRPSPHLIAAMGERLKAFFHGEWRGGQLGWSIGTEAPNQDW